MSMRMAASACHVLQVMSVPCGARMTRFWGSGMYLETPGLVVVLMVCILNRV